MSTLSIVIPCYNEEKTIADCVRDLLDVDWGDILLDVIIVNDGSSDRSLEIARELCIKYPFVKVIDQERNLGKGAALRTGFAAARGDFVAVQDADREYDPSDLRRLLGPLLSGKADVVFGSRFMSSHEHRVLHFWHSQGNRFLTLLSNMFTDMNLTDMETCYKVFKREIIQSIQIEENRFGFEPEVVAKIADRRCRVYEMGVSYFGRTYAEGKKIGVKDGFRALYCIIRYNSHRASAPVQFIAYSFIGGLSAILNLLVFLALFSTTSDVLQSSIAAFVLAAMLNYYLCIKLIFRQKSRWSLSKEIPVYVLVVCIGAAIDASTTMVMVSAGMWPWLAKCVGTAISLVANFIGRRFLVFGVNERGPWK